MGRLHSIQRQSNPTEFTSFVFFSLVDDNGSCLLRWWLLPTSSCNEDFNFAFQFIQVAMKNKVLATNDSKHIVTAIFFFSSSVNK